jgi:hypothetical protein
MTERCRTQSIASHLCLALVSVLLWSSLVSAASAEPALDSSETLVPAPTPAPSEDRLAEPVMPESPTQVDTGRSLYWLHCMPCHGDRGQGLTDEWREVWVEDHQNCWKRGCHTGASDLAAFYIPREVPAVSGSPQALRSFETAEALVTFLRETQPPQRPGVLSEGEYRALATFLLHENGRLPQDVSIGPEARAGSVSGRDFGPAVLAPLLALALAVWLGKRQ